MLAKKIWNTLLINAPGQRDLIRYATLLNRPTAISLTEKFSKSAKRTQLGFRIVFKLYAECRRAVDRFSAEWKQSAGVTGAAFRSTTMLVGGQHAVARWRLRRRIPHALHSDCPRMPVRH